VNYIFANGVVVRVDHEERTRGMKTIRVLRQGRGWTQFELALKVGVQPQAVYLWESGRRTPQVPQLRKLGELFGLCSDEIVLEPVAGPDRARHRPRADRQPGEPVPGRDESGRVTARGGGAPGTDRGEEESG
jgi:DNA-binding XRE family transcriptional regulator